MKKFLNILCLKESINNQKNQIMKETKNITKERKKRGEHRLYSVEDEEWEEKFKSELQKKKKVIIIIKIFYK